MANTHITSNQTVNESVNNMVSYNDTIFRSQRKRIFLVFFIPLLIIFTLLAVAFGFRDAIFGALGINLSIDASQTEENINENDDIELFLTAVNGVGSDYADSGFNISNLTFKIDDAANGLTYDGSAKDLVLEGLPDDAKIIGKYIVDVDATEDKYNVDLTNIADLENNFNTYASGNKLVRVTSIKDAGRYYVRAVIDDPEANDGTDFSGVIVDKYQTTTIATPSYITITKKDLPSTLSVSLANTTVDYNAISHNSDFVIVNLPTDFPASDITRNFKVGTNDVTEAQNVGTYKLLSVKLSTRNYVEKTLTLAAGTEPILVINPADPEQYIDFTPLTPDYDGAEHVLEFKFKSDVSTAIKNEINANCTKIYTDHINGLNISSDDRKFVNCTDTPKYIDLTISGPNFMTKTLSAYAQIQRIDLPNADIMEFKFNESYYTGTYFDPLLVTNVVDDPTIIVTYYKQDFLGNRIPVSADKMAFKNVVDSGTYIAKIEGPNYYNKIELVADVVIKPANLNNGGITFASINRNYDPKKTDVVKVVFNSGYENIEQYIDITYYDEKGNMLTSDIKKHNAENTTITAVFTIAPEEINNIEYILPITASININRIVFPGFKSPDKTFAYKELTNNLFDPMSVITTKLPDGITVTPIIKYLPMNKNFIMHGAQAKTVTEINKLGNYHIEYVFNQNYIAGPIEFEVRFNPLVVPIGILIALIVTLLILVFTMPGKRRKDRKSRQRFIAIRTQLVNERDGVVCESFATSKDKFANKKGRLYLTGKALEFYDKNYDKNYRNTVILAKDIIDIKCKGTFGGKLIILSRGGVQKFKVPAGTAKLWKKELNQYKYLEQCYYSEVHILNSGKQNKPSKAELKAEKKRKNDIV